MNLAKGFDFQLIKTALRVILCSCFLQPHVYHEIESDFNLGGWQSFFGRTFDSNDRGVLSIGKLL